MEIKSKMEEIKAQMDMTPMIDCVFLLIIFFMLVSQFSNQINSAGIILPIAANSIEDDPGKRLVINVDRDGKYIIMGIQHPKEVVKQKVIAYGALVQVDFHGMMISDMKVMIRADKYTPYKHVQEIYYLLQEGAIWKVCFATSKTKK